MKRLFIKLLAFSLIVTAISAAVFFGGNFGITGMNSHNYQKGYVYQYRALQNSDKDKAKIIVIGGSYMTFSVDSEKLGKYTGMPVYTLGVHSGMGMCYVLEDAQKFINENDIVLFPFYPFKADDYGSDLICLTLDDEPDMYWDFFSRHPLYALKSAGTMTYKKISSKVISALRGSFDDETDYSSSVYFAESFDPQTGNMVFDRPECIIDSVDREVEYDFEKLDGSCIAKTNEFIDFCRQKNARIYISFAPCCKDAVLSSDEQIAEYEASLKNALNAEVISSLSDMLLPLDYLYDGNPHLNNNGVAHYTEQLYRDLSSAENFKQ